MKLRRLILRDFRQFKGENELVFSDHPARNVTLVIGATGSGKTTLLNALTWVLYGAVTNDFWFPERLINEQTWADTVIGDEATSSVTITFEHEESTYTLTRRYHAVKRGEGVDQAGSQDVQMLRADTRGRTREVKAPNDFIDNLLPKKLHHFFFLNGERFDHLHDDAAYSDIESAIKTLLGVKVLERALSHLPDVQRELRREYSAIGGSDIEALNRQIETAETNKRTAIQRREETAAESEALRGEIAALDDRLMSLGKARELQARRASLVREEEAADSAIQRTEVRREKLVSEEGFVAFIGPLLNQTIDTYEALRARSEIPRPFKAQFIDDLLELGTCICGSDLKSSGTPRDRVLEWRERAGLPEVEQSWAGLTAQAKNLVRVRQGLSDRLDSYAADLVRERETKEKAQEELSEISKELENSDEDISALEVQRQQLRAKERASNEHIGALRLEIEGYDQRIALAKKQLDAAEALNREAEVARRRVAAVDHAESILENALALRVEDVRATLDRRINENFQSIIYHDYHTTLTNHFRLELFKVVNGHKIEVGKSSGEGQVLVVSFVGALATTAREASEGTEGFGGIFGGSTGGSFPLVTDAIFGTLAGSYKRAVTRALPEVAPQLVVFVNQDQGASVEQELRDRVGSLYVLESQSTRVDAHVEEIELEGRTWPLIAVSPEGVEQTRLLPVRSAS